ncbi:nickel/cobalt transporter [Agrobacterium sp. a22-2]|uniref:nickel/cobalt transporter n=1 Tax=Agrobacterium sp. a22-2 TaxID=2283840 RepID=UPI001445FC78|nr:nickel/cobalt transporter [Agrobacterium sp. a22-2]NKN35432.1 nickel/cobalt transporter [Agrobacterium sp. a22-2]
MLTAGRITRIAALGLLLGLSATLAHAASPLGIGTAEPSFQVAGPFGGLLAWINTNQQAFYRALTGALKAMRDNPAHLATLIGLSFAYGVFHAAGPGHGKAVISSYMIANETELKRGIVISFVSAMLQGAVAIALVGFAYLLLRGTAISMTDATRAMEIASFGLIIAFGVWLLVKKLKGLAPARRLAMPVSAGLFDNATPGSARTGTTGLTFQAVSISHDHDALSPGSTCPDCGMTHLPDPKLLAAPDFRLREAWSAVIAVGLRPCSGALLVMTFALLNGLYLGGVLSVFAMAVGTAITVSALAAIAVTAKDIAVRLSGPGSPTARRVATGLEIAGALLVIVMGALLLAAALQS